jgi:ATP-binding cassette subfamily C (CFTR/MRP) protein 2
MFPLQASTDQTAVDLKIPYLVGQIAFTMIQLLGITPVMSLAAWQVFIIFIPVIGTCIWYQVHHLTSSECVLHIMLKHGLIGWHLKWHK